MVRCVRCVIGMCQSSTYAVRAVRSSYDRFELVTETQDRVVQPRHRIDAIEARTYATEEDIESAVATISMDHAHIAEKSNDVKESAKPVMVIYDRKSKSITGRLSSCKGAGDDWLIQRSIADIEDVGYAGKKLFLKISLTGVLP